MEQQKFDVVVLGGGPGGYPAAIRAAQCGKSVALVEARELGGTCLNRGCIPSKTLIAGAEFYARLAEASSFGVEIPSFSFNYARLALHKDEVVKKMREGLEGLIAANKITLFHGWGELISGSEIKVMGNSSHLLKAENIILATGSEPKEIPAFPFDYEKIHDSTSFLRLTSLPKSIAIIGGGVIGCEFASLLAHLGVKVTLFELLPSILSTEAEDVSRMITESFVRQGIQVLTGVKVQNILKSQEGVQVLLDSGERYDAECSLVAVGRSLNTNKIGLEKAAVFVEENGIVRVNQHMQTTRDGIYAVGDIASKWWLAHVATHQGLVAADHICGRSSAMHYDAIPSVIFTRPEVGSVGLSLENALKQGFKAQKFSFPFQALGKAQAAIETEGFAQIVFDPSTGQILGGQVVGFEASSLIAEIGVAITNELTIESIAETIHAHPTYAEAWGEVASLAQGFPISLPPKKRIKK